MTDPSTDDPRRPLDPEATEPEEQPARPRMTPQNIETWVDQAIKQAQRRGDFDDLPGAGKPLKDLDRPHDPDWWVKGLIERERLEMIEAMPGAIALRRERETFPEALLELAEETAVRAHLEDFNERVLADRRKPHAGPGSPVVVGRVDVEDMVARWHELRAAAVAKAARAQAQAQAQAEPDDRRDPAPQRRRRWWRRR